MLNEFLILGWCFVASLQSWGTVGRKEEYVALLSVFYMRKIELEDNLRLSSTSWRCHTKAKSPFRNTTFCYISSEREYLVGSLVRNLFTRWQKLKKLHMAPLQSNGHHLSNGAIPMKMEIFPLNVLRYGPIPIENKDYFFSTGLFSNSPTLSTFLCVYFCLDCLP